MLKFQPILILAAAAILPVSGAVAQTPISITLSNYSFSPTAIQLQAGTTYILHLVNNGSKDHNFSAPEFFAASQIAPDDASKVEKGLVDLGSGQSVDVTVTPGRAGSFAVECTHFMHKMMGMHGVITVQ